VKILERFGDVAIMLSAAEQAFTMAQFWDYRLNFIWEHVQPRSFPGGNTPLLYHDHILLLAKTKEVKTGWKRPTPEFGSIFRTTWDYWRQTHGKSAEVFVSMLAGFAGWKRVADPFFFSGATLIACEYSGRLCVGVENDPAHLALGFERLSEIGLTPEAL